MAIKEFETKKYLFTDSNCSISKNFSNKNNSRIKNKIGNEKLKTKKYHLSIPIIPITKVLVTIVIKTMAI